MIVVNKLSKKSTANVGIENREKKYKGVKRCKGGPKMCGKRETFR